ncbi:hypothetical protein, partial [Brevundimonas sp.]|uniref:hypothetical protein n=1 Tax=Brevundimonas sp. TaxID=1871086 RepID=UPI0028A063D0
MARMRIGLGGRRGRHIVARMGIGGGGRSRHLVARVGIGRGRRLRWRHDVTGVRILLGGPCGRLRRGCWSRGGARRRRG